MLQLIYLKSIISLLCKLHNIPCCEAELFESHYLAGLATCGGRRRGGVGDTPNPANGRPPLRTLLLSTFKMSWQVDGQESLVFSFPVGTGSSRAGKREERRSPIIQPIAPRARVSPSQMSKSVFSETLRTANIAASMMPNVKPVVIPMRQPGCARFRPRNFFIIE